MKELTLDLVKELSSLYGDSFYILDSDVFRTNCEKLLNAYRKYYSRTNIAYSYKTNYIPKLVKIVDKLGGYAEVVSEMELEIARRSGVSYKRIVWNGPVKRLEAIESFLLSGGTINIDNVTEFSKIHRIALKHPDTLLSIGIRCNYDVGDGVVSRFGFDINGDEFTSVVHSIAITENLKLKNLHAHFAKRHFKYWPAKADGILDVFERLHSEYGLNPECLDLGGGLSGEMPDSLRDQLSLERFSYDDYASRAALRFKEFFGDTEIRPWLFIEPGTAVAADCMRYVCRVESIKTVRGKTIITTNGSQKNISMSGINPPMALLSSCFGKTHVVEADIAGYTCIESDYLYKNYTGEINVGDYLVFGNCGSYSVVMKPPFIFPNVPIIDISSGSIEEIKRAERFDDLFCTYNF